MFLFHVGSILAEATAADSLSRAIVDLDGSRRVGSISDIRQLSAVFSEGRNGPHSGIGPFMFLENGERSGEIAWCQPALLGLVALGYGPVKVL